jgi:hypothetical protein
VLKRALHAACPLALCPLAARAQKEFDAALPAFRKLFSSYRFTPDKVVTGAR